MSFLYLPISRVEQRRARRTFQKGTIGKLIQSGGLLLAFPRVALSHNELHRLLHYLSPGIAAAPSLGTDDLEVE